MIAVSADFSEAAARLFWSRVNKTDDCWLWTGPTNGRYGRIGRRTYAHRMAYELAYGPIPEGMFVMHRCDVTRCVRPDHLTLGTAADNTADAVAKGRLAKGARHGSRTHPEAVPRGARHGTRTVPWAFQRGSLKKSAKLNEAQVREIRARSDQGATRASLAREFGVTTTVIRKIALRESWRHVI
jgi:hypothetical protein